MLRVVALLIKASRRLRECFRISRSQADLDSYSGSVDDSRMSLTSIQKEIVHLNSSEHTMLIDEVNPKEVEAQWAAESEERIDAVDRGELATVDGPSALRQLRSLLKK